MNLYRQHLRSRRYHQRGRCAAWEAAVNGEDWRLEKAQHVFVLFDLEDCPTKPEIADAYIAFAAGWWDSEIDIRSDLERRGIYETNTA